MKIISLSFALVPVLAGSITPCHGQQVYEKRDSLDASVITADRGRRKDAGIRILSPGEVSVMVSSVGEPDVVKFIQTLPGVSTGAEGSSAIYVRGGNLGSNLQTLDGVPVYGSSHMLGMTTVYPQDIISSAQFLIGGFTSEEGNLTSSHISLTTADGDFHKLGAKASASNFMAGAMVSTPIVADRLSVLASARVSPLGAELSAVKGLSSAMDEISGIRSAIYDAFVKLSYRSGERNTISASWFSSMDSYGYTFRQDSDDRMRWSNSIINISDRYSFRSGWALQSQISRNSFSNYQGMRRVLSGSGNNLGVQSSIDEMTLQSTLKGRLYKIFDYQGGVKFRYASFAPASSGYYSEGIIAPVEKPSDKDVVISRLVTLHSQLEWNRNPKYNVRLSGRLNKYSSTRQKTNETTARPLEGEFGLMAKANVTSWMGFEGTADLTRQYYHTLEGLPLGWNLDMIVPSDQTCAPESAQQFYLGWFGSFGQHRFSLGAYTKEMSNLVYLPDAVQVFSPAAAGWRSGVNTGKGSSKGVEFLYEKDGERLSWKLSYTLSKTDRQFESINHGKPFNAQYDRRHILNLTGDYTISSTESRTFGATGLFTYQSGNWTTVPAGHIFVQNPVTGASQDIPYYTFLNNWQMPAYIRLDAGLFLKYGRNTSHPGQLNIGIYNLLNRHNPYSLTYDSETRKWKQVSLFPIMPSISWSMKF